MISKFSRGRFIAMVTGALGLFGFRHKGKDKITLPYWDGNPEHFTILQVGDVYMIGDILYVRGWHLLNRSIKNPQLPIDYVCAVSARREYPTWVIGGYGPDELMAISNAWREQNAERVG